MTEDQTTPEVPVQEPSQDGRIVIVMKGDSPIPIYVDFAKVSPFHMIAMGEWLALKGRQLIVMAESAELAGSAPQIAVPGMSEEMIQEILGVNKS